MSMCCPESIIERLKDKPCEKLIKERDKLISEIRHFEENKEKLMEYEYLSYEEINRDN